MSEPASNSSPDRAQQLREFLEKPEDLKNAITITSMEQIEDIQKRQASGEQVSLEEYRAAYRFLRQNRMTAAAAAPKGGKKADLSEAARQALDDLL